MNQREYDQAIKEENEILLLELKYFLKRDVMVSDYENFHKTYKMGDVSGYDLHHIPTETKIGRMATDYSKPNSRTLKFERNEKSRL
jgi:hypothetical protein